MTWILLWFRNDLRLHDHQPLTAALQTGQPVIPLYCFDPRQFGQTTFGFAKMGAFRAEFLRESVADLRQMLRSRRSDLLIRQGLPEDIIPALVQDLQLTGVYWHQEITAEEVAVEAKLQRRLQEMGVTVQTFWGHTLYHPDDLPWSLTQLPEVFTHFRKQVEGNIPIRAALPTPSALPPLPEVTAGECPTLADLGVAPPRLDSRTMLKFTGGETAALERMQTYIWTCDRLRCYKETRNGLLAVDDSSKFSPWLALGCLSPRRVYAEVERYEAERVKNESTYWLVFELLWRDYFRLIAAKHGNAIFRPTGLQGLALPWQEDWPRFQLWQSGQTGFPLVDAGMQELRATGFLSNRGRQNVASFLTKNLGINWQMGAEWFESCLIDYDVCSNWGNWNYTAGVGNDARGFRFFNIIKQAQTYDPEGEYVKHWLPMLRSLPPRLVHQPWQLSPAAQRQRGVRLGVDYPNPVVDLFKSADTNAQRYEAAQQLTRRKRPQRQN
ncbi:DASH family cryptochrome [Synechococcales cyanobacterium C]|uniref:Cryptochrome DASH n=1 Tax=Petrachloros mirabilis ULC683 TaxID=2781853 RepID=A0A8K2A7Z2_9CYAN|nr:DASH family cryptochrome [Petrachloros mirabilis]NCJ06699.1 DASH family cryptochrome [Petrachloros mirabilis ULC683]